METLSIFILEQFQVHSKIGQAKTSCTSLQSPLPTHSFPYYQHPRPEFPTTFYMASMTRCPNPGDRKITHKSHPETKEKILINKPNLEIYEKDNTLCKLRVPQNVGQTNNR